MVFTELLPELHGGALGLAGQGIFRKSVDRALLLAERGRPDVQDVGQPLEFNRAVHAQIRARAAWQLAVSSTSTVTVPCLRRRVDAHDPTRNDAVARVDLGLLADGQIARLRFGNPQFGLEARRVGDAGEVGAGRHLLADVDGDLLEHAVHAGAHAQLLDLRTPQL
jgi:hypothetical protein